MAQAAEAGFGFISILLSSCSVLRDLSRDDSRLASRLQYQFVLLLVPPLFSCIGGVLFGWRLGASERLRLQRELGVIISIRRTLVNGRNGKMPTFEGKLDDLQVKLLVAWLLR